jgi:Uma2 family endonuclease
MAISHRRRTFSAGEYLRLERLAETRSEFYAGEIFALAGASRGYNTIVINCAAELRAQLKGRPCNVYASDFRVEVQAGHHYTYPDVVVTCGEERFLDSERDTLQNPGLIIEGLSPSTAAYDRGDKFASYRTLPPLQTYVLV